LTLLTDVFDTIKRSEIMSRVRSSGNLATELRMIQIFRSYRVTGWRRKALLFGKPDFVFPGARLALFIDGCFWHGCKKHGSVPGTNNLFWMKKLERNKRRDRIVNARLKSLGWFVLRLWQHELKDPEKVVKRLSRHLSIITSSLDN
jgi:DNA mismatch endonuclease, patch repair protein